MSAPTLDVPASGREQTIRGRAPGGATAAGPRPWYRRALRGRARRDPRRVAAVRGRVRRVLGVDHPEPAWWGWATALVLGVLAGIIRFWRLGNPAQLVFDETYYVKQAYSYLVSGGVEWKWDNDASTITADGATSVSPGADEQFTNGTLDVFTRQPDFVVHPPLGKWMIALGMEGLGADDPVSWRFMSALCGTLMVVILVFVARRLFGSTLLGGLAGLLLAVDGHHIVHSRTGLLDIFLSFWALVAFAFVLADRFWFRSRLAAAEARRRVAKDGRPGWGLFVPFRPWLLATGLALGAACAVKWSGLWFVAAFGLMVVAWDIGARRGIGARNWLRSGVLRDGPVAFVHLVPTAAAVYVLSWFGWFRSSDGYDRQWAADNPQSTLVQWLPDSLASLVHYHRQMLEFHENLRTPHDYQAHPWSWIVMARPTSFFYESPKSGELGCTVAECSRAITSLGNPVIWWAGAASIVVCALAWLLRRDWRAGALLVPLAAGWLPWFLFAERTIYTFYAVAFVPYVVLALTYSLGLLIGPPDADDTRRSWGAAVAGVIVILAVGALLFFYPVWTAQVIPRAQWEWRMWWPSWI